MLVTFDAVELPVAVAAEVVPETFGVSSTLVYVFIFLLSDEVVGWTVILDFMRAIGPGSVLLLTLLAEVRKVLTVLVCCTL